MRHLAAAVVLSCIAASLHAETRATINPIEGVKAFKIEYLLGEAMTREPVARLFEDDRGRAERFEAGLIAAIRDQFAETGIEMTPDARHTLVIGIWGQTVDQESCGRTSFALAELSFHDERKLDDPDFDGSIETWGSKLLDVSPDGALEESLREAILQRLEEMLHRGTGAP